jgi:hypothetical protein
LAPSLLADVDVGQDLFELLVEACAPIMVAGSSGLPWRIFCTRATARSMNFS